VPYSIAPYYLKAKGEKEGVYVRFGSTNRLADSHTIAEIKRLKEHSSFDELPRLNCPLDQINFDPIKEHFRSPHRKFTANTAKSLGLITTHQEKEAPTNGAILLFGRNHTQFFPDAVVRLGRFQGTTRTVILDSKRLEEPLTQVLEPVLAFISRHTSTRSQFGGLRRQDIPEYPPTVIREAIINALLHTDYSIRGSSIQRAIFDDRLEITNPGGLPFGLSLEKALSGMSQLRNHVIGRVFRELDLIEQWGSGLGRMLQICQEQGIQLPKFEEIDRFFRVTLYSSMGKTIATKSWHKPLIAYIEQRGDVTAKKAQEVWQVSSRTTSTRLKQMCEEGLLAEIATSPFDPQKTYRLRRA